MRMLAIPWTVALGVAVVSTSAWGQIENSTFPLVQACGDSLVLTYDSSLVSPTNALPLHNTCTAAAPCAGLTIYVDTPLWRDDSTEMEDFRDSVRELVSFTNNEEAFADSPRIVFTNLGDDSTSTLDAYESIIMQETIDIDAVVEMDLPAY